MRNEQADRQTDMSPKTSVGDMKKSKGVLVSIESNMLPLQLLIDTKNCHRNSLPFHLDSFPCVTATQVKKWTTSIHLHFFRKRLTQVYFSSKSQLFSVKCLDIIKLNVVLDSWQKCLIVSVYDQEKPFPWKG